jgi:hypothetical protein
MNPPPITTHSLMWAGFEGAGLHVRTYTLNREIDRVHNYPVKEQENKLYIHIHIHIHTGWLHVMVSLTHEKRSLVHSDTRL